MSTSVQVPWPSCRLRGWLADQSSKTADSVAFQGNQCHPTPRLIGPASHALTACPYSFQNPLIGLLFFLPFSITVAVSATANFQIPRSCPATPPDLPSGSHMPPRLQLPAISFYRRPISQFPRVKYISTMATRKLHPTSPANPSSNKWEKNRKDEKTS